MWFWIVFLVVLGPFQEVHLSSSKCNDTSRKICDYIAQKEPYTGNDVRNEETVAITHLSDVFLVYVGKKAKEEGYDPMKMPDRTVDYGIRLYDGSATGFSEVERVGDTLLTTRNDTVALTIALQMNSASVFYKWKRKLLFVYIYGTLKVSVKKIVILAQLLQKIDTGEHPKLYKYSVPKMGDIYIEFSGLGPLNSRIKSEVKNIAREELSNLLHKKIPDIITKHLSRFTL